MHSYAKLALIKESSGSMLRFDMIFYFQQKLEVKNLICWLATEYSEKTYRLKTIMSAVIELMLTPTTSIVAAPPTNSTVNPLLPLSVTCVM